MPNYRSGKHGGASVMAPTATTTPATPTTLNKIGGAIDWELSVTPNIIDATALGDEFQYNEFGTIGWSARVSFFVAEEHASTNQDELLELLFPKADGYGGTVAASAKVQLNLYDNAIRVAPISTNVWYGNARPSGARITIGVDQLVRAEVDFTGYGILSFTAH